MNKIDRRRGFQKSFSRTVPMFCSFELFFVHLNYFLFIKELFVGSFEQFNFHSNFRFIRTLGSFEIFFCNFKTISFIATSSWIIMHQIYRKNSSKCVNLNCMICIRHDSSSWTIVQTAVVQRGNHLSFLNPAFFHDNHWDTSLKFNRN